jgi:hypothetical protein
MNCREIQNFEKVLKKVYNFYLCSIHSPTKSIEYAKF